ncbi:hypothetical protein BH23ACT12_BH23ACT12_00670 [soil metagenome]
MPQASQGGRTGLTAGFVTYTVIKLLRGEARDVHWMMYLSSAAF